MKGNIKYITSVQIPNWFSKLLIEFYLEKVPNPLSYNLLFKIGDTVSIKTNDYHYLKMYSFQSYNEGRDFIINHPEQLIEDALFIYEGKKRENSSIEIVKESTPANSTSSQEKEKGYEMVNHPQHYNLYSEETIEIMKDVYGPDAVALWSEMTAFKYRMRMGTKPGSPVEQDLEKEKVYLGFRDYYKTDNYQNLLKQLKNAD